MTQIVQLSRASSIVDGDIFPVYIAEDGDTRGVTAKRVAEYVQTTVDQSAEQLRADLADPAQGAELVAGTDIPLADYTALRAYAGAQSRVYITGPLASAKPYGTAGSFQHDPTDTTSADNGGTVIVGADSRRWKRDFVGPLAPTWFGVIADGTTDDTSAWENWIAECAARKIPFFSYQRLTSRITDTLVFPNTSVTAGGTVAQLPVYMQNVSFIYDGTRDRPAIDIGVAPALSGYFAESEIHLPRIAANGTLSWPGTLGVGDIGIRVRQAFRCRIYENYVYGFTNGIVYSGCAYNEIHAKYIADCKFGLVCTTEGANHDHSFFNENTRYSGKIGNSSGSIALGTAYQVVFTWDKTSSYRGHNTNRFIASCFESNASGTYQLPIYFDGVGVSNVFEKVRLEGTKGPVAIFDGGGGTYGNNNKIDVQYMAYTGQEIAIRQVNSAAGNVLTGVGCVDSEWHSGDMSRLVTSAGAAGTAHISGREFFFLNAGTPTVADIKKTETTFTTAIQTNRTGIQIAAGSAFRVGVAIDTTKIKDFVCSYSAPSSAVGRPWFMPIDASGSALSGLATESFVNPLTAAVYANEPYVKAVPGSSDATQIITVSGSQHTISADIPLARSLRVTVRPEVHTLLFCVVGASGPAIVQSMHVKAFATYNAIGETYPTSTGRLAVRVFSPLDDDGGDAYASASPSSGTMGYYPRGKVILNSVAASGVASGWICTLAGWKAPAWTISTAYGYAGMLVTNDTGKVYELTTPGTSAGAGGPTGTTATFDGITDNTCKWRYVGVLATFTPMANIP